MKGLFILKYLLIVVIILTIINKPCFAQAEQISEVINLRTEYSKTFNLGNGKYRLYPEKQLVHFKDDYADKKEEWKTINLEWENNKVVNAPYTLEKIDDTYYITDRRNEKSGYIKPITKGVKLELSNSSIAFTYEFEVLPINVQYEYKGNLFIEAKAHDNTGSIKVNVTNIGDIYTERIDNIVSLDDDKVRLQNGKIVVNPIVDIDIEASLDDGHTYGATLYTTTETGYVGAYGAPSVNRYEIFNGITIPLGSTIDEAYANYYLSASAGNPITEISFEDILNPEQPADVSEYNAKISTTTRVAQVDSMGANGWKVTNSLIEPIQELVNSYNYDDDEMCLLWKDNESTDSNYYQFVYWDYDLHQLASSLYIEYSLPAETPIVPTNFTITDLEGITASANWTASVNATEYLLLVNRFDYPDNPLGSYEFAYSGNSTTVNMTGFNFDYNKYYFSLWAKNVEGYSLYYAIANEGQSLLYAEEGEGMGITHFIAFLPLIIFFILSLVFYGKALVHVITLGYALSLGYVAILNGWEILFFVPLIGTGIVALLLFWYAIIKGGWL